MPDRPNTIIVKSPKIPKKRSSGIKASQGVVIIEMVPPNDRFGSLYLPDNVAGAERSDVGRVISSGYPGVDTGDIVGVRPYDGTERTDFQIGNEDAIPLVKFIGVYCGAGDDPVKFDLSESLLFKLGDDMSIRPIGKNILLKVESVKETTDSGIYLPDDAKWRTNVAEVLAVGDEVTEVKPGDTIIYHPMAPMFDFEGEIPENYGIMLESGVEAILA